MVQVLNDGDNPNLVNFNVTSPLTTTLDWASEQNFSRTFQNIGTANVTLAPNAPPGYVGPLYKINGASSFPIPPGGRYTVTYINSQWTAYVLSTTPVPVVPTTFTPAADKWLTGYDATTGGFSDSQPAFSNISGNLAAVALAALTPTGAQGSAVFTNGLLVSYTAPS